MELEKKDKKPFTGYNPPNDGSIPLSACCAEEMPNYNESDLCPTCGEHTGVLEEED